MPVPLQVVLTLVCAAIGGFLGNFVYALQWEFLKRRFGWKESDLIAQTFKYSARVLPEVIVLAVAASIFGWWKPIGLQIKDWALGAPIAQPQVQVTTQAPAQPTQTPKSALAKPAQVSSPQGKLLPASPHYTNEEKDVMLNTLGELRSFLKQGYDSLETTYPNVVRIAGANEPHLLGEFPPLKVGELASVSQELDRLSQATGMRGVQMIRILDHAGGLKPEIAGVITADGSGLRSTLLKAIDNLASVLKLPAAKITHGPDDDMVPLPLYGPLAADLEQALFAYEAWERGCVERIDQKTKEIRTWT
ncbi:MAG: hypothetical protein ACRD3E_19880 [Terriglobales bacterium]